MGKFCIQCTEIESYYIYHLCSSKSAQNAAVIRVLKARGAERRIIACGERA